MIIGDARLARRSALPHRVQGGSHDNGSDHEPMPGLARPGQKVRWRNPGEARACGWEALFGPGPFVVVRIVDHSAHGLATGLVLRTAHWGARDS